jgi:hypothetical protein
MGVSWAVSRCRINAGMIAVTSSGTFLDGMVEG